MNSGGSRKTISSAYTNISGSQKQIFPYSTTTIYTWNYYTIKTTTSGYTASYRTYDSGSINIPYNTCYRTTDTEPSINDSDGTFSFTGVSQKGLISHDVNFPHHYVGFKYGIDYADFISDSQLNGYGYTNYYYCDSGNTLYIELEDNYIYAYNNKLVREYYTTANTTQSVGSYVGQVTSTSYYDYPYDGISGNYWYIMQ